MTVVRNLLFAVSLVLEACVLSQAQFAGQVNSVRLVTSNAGWASTGQKLFWTANGGVHWSEITPKARHKRQNISSVYFLDGSTGWVLLTCADDKDAFADDVCFEFASTTNAGESWTFVHPKIVDPGIDQSNIDDGIGVYSGATFLNFADSLHGWAILRKSYNVSRSVGEMLRTSDGGRTWTQLAGDTPPMADPFRFITAKDGWIVGGPDSQIFVTHNAGDSWQELSLPKPPNVGEDFGIDISLPSSHEKQRGSFSVRYLVGPVTGPNLSTLVLFTTEDSGKTWTPNGMLSRIPITYSSEVVGSTLMTASSEVETVPQGEGQCAIRSISVSLLSVGPDRASSQVTASMPIPEGPVSQLSFVSPEKGWATVLGRVFATDDAGRTWSEVTPGGPPPYRPSVCVPAR